MNFMVIVAYAAGVLLLYGLGKMLLIPLRTIFNLMVNAVIGGGGLLLIAFVGGIGGFHVGVSPDTALVVGLLGVPGVLLLIALRLLFA